VSDDALFFARFEQAIGNASVAEQQSRVPDIADVTKALAEMLKLGSVHVSSAHPAPFKIGNTVGAQSRPLPARFSRVATRVAKMATLPPGWDGPDSVPPSSAAQRAAHMIVETFASSSLQYQRVARENSRTLIVSADPQVAPRADGGYQFEWRHDGRELYVGCDQSGALDFLECSADHEKEFRGDVAALRRALRWFFNG
jgi:hypothetical protein